MRKSKKFMIVSIIILIISIIGSGVTYAWYFWSTNSEEETKIVTSVGAATIYFDAGGEVSANLKPVSTKEEGIVKEIKVKSNVTNELMFNLYLDINTLDDGLKDESFKFAIYKEDELVKEGNFSQDYLNSNLETCNVNNTNHIILLSDEIITTTQVTYKLYIWIDGANYTNPNSMQNTKFSFKMHADGEGAMIKEGIIPDITEISNDQKGTLAYKIISEYYFADKSVVTNNGVVYYYDTEHNLMSDVGGNVRYYGASPNNYIYFNCSDYSNQSSSTCELWRIIGVFDGKVKIIRNSSIGSYSWDNKTYGIGTSISGNGSNAWSDSRLMMLLNPGYENGLTADDGDIIYEYTGSLYWNAKSGTCYSGDNNATISCEFSNNGLKNDITRNLISENLWYLGGWNTASVYSDQIYSYERGMNVCRKNRPISWTGKIAIPYLSDYGYSADLSYCNHLLVNYENSECTSVNWMKSINSSNYSFFLTPGTNYCDQIFAFQSSGHALGGLAVNNANGVLPVLYLNSNLSIVSGDGSESNPYSLSVS